MAEFEVKGTYDPAWRCTNVRDCAQTLLNLTGYKGAVGQERFAQRISAEVEKAREADNLPWKFPTFDTKVVKRWTEQGVFEEDDRKFLPFVQRVLGIGIADSNELYRCFTSNSYKVKVADHIVLIRQDYAAGVPNSYAKGYFADYMNTAMEHFGLTAEELSLRTGIYPTFMKGFTRGALVPQGEALQRLTRELNASCDPEQANLMEALIERDLKRFANRYPVTAPKAIPLLKALGSITRDTYLHEFIDNAFSSPGVAGLQFTDIPERPGMAGPYAAKPLVVRMRDKSRAAAEAGRYIDYSLNPVSGENAKALGSGISIILRNSTDLYEKMFVEFAFRRPQRRSLGQLLDSYIESGKTDFRQFFDSVAEQWNVNFTEMCETLKLSPVGFRAPETDGYFSTQMLGELAKREQLSLQQQQDLVALRKGTLGLGKIEDIVRGAQAILNADKPTFGAFADNPVALRIKGMPAHAHSRQASPIDKELVPNALLAVLLERTGISITPFMEGLGKKRSGHDGQTYGSILTGEGGFLISHGGLNYQYDKAKPAAAVFTDDLVLADNLALAFLGEGQKFTPDEWFKKVSDKEATIGQMVRGLRIAEFLSKENLAKAVTNTPTPSDVFITRLEDNIADCSPEKAQGLADYFYKDSPEAVSKEDFKAALSGKAYGKKAEDHLLKLVGSIERDIKAGYKNFGKEGAPTLATLMPKITELVSGGNVPSFATQVGISESTYYEWLKPSTKIGRKEHAKAVANLLVDYGIDDGLKQQFLALAQHLVPQYDPAILAGISTSSGAEERSTALSAMRDKLHISILDMGAEIKMNPNNYSHLESAGWIDDQAKNRERRLAQIAGTLIPEDAENCIEERTKLAKILGTRPPGMNAPGHTRTGRE